MAVVDLCDQAPCGPYAQCQTVDNHIKCTCLPNCIGSPPYCRLECTINEDCPLSKACDRNKCIDPCIGSCAKNAQCRVVMHSPVCVCPPQFTGDPFTYCEPESKNDFLRDNFFIFNHFSIQKGIPIEREEDQKDPCFPSPCGPNSKCENYNGFAKCSCLPNYYGKSPNCRPECILNSDCPSNQACINKKCSDPCKSMCGINAICNVVNRYPICSCPPHLPKGDPVIRCDTMPDRKRQL